MPAHGPVPPGFARRGKVLGRVSSRRLEDLMRDLILARQGRRCFYCARPLGDDLGGESVLDHLVPKSRGGPDGEANRVAACEMCDRIKGDRMPTEDELARQARFRGES